MDHREFDRLTRIVGAGQSRRGMLKSLAGGTLGAVAVALGVDLAAAAARCRGQDSICTKKADCCSSACLPKDRTGRRYCAECGSASNCPKGDQCHAAICDASNSCGLIAATGTLCDSGGGADSGICQEDGTCVTHGAACVAEPDVFGTCPGGQYCDLGYCACHVGACAIASDCGPYFDGCLGGCCCAESGNQIVGCAPGHNNDCCSGYCDSNGLCADPPPP
jgi:hypothetical protein